MIRVSYIVRNIVFSWLALSALFTLLLVAVYAIPDELVSKNVIASADYNEADAYDEIEGSPQTKVSTSTVTIMLSMACHMRSDDTIIKAAMRGSYFHDIEKLGDFDSIRLGINESPNNTYEYYWHGWLVFVKPLLLFFNYGGIKKVLWFIFLVLLAVINKEWGLPSLVPRKALELGYDQQLCTKE